MDQIELAQHEQSVRTFIQDAMGNMDLAGLELSRLIKMVANLYEVMNDEQLRHAELSGPRLRLLMRLWAEEAHGHQEGTPPTHLSRAQNVSKNTISALLRGLEEQGLIERTLCTEDRRSFRIRLTPAGRQLVQATAPQHLAYLNHLAAGLSGDERTQLIGLLQKLYGSLARKATLAVGPDPIAAEPPLVCPDL
jgi:DNA-binding MarR family transcriptional regulator